MNVWLSGEGCQILILTPDTLLVTRSQSEMSSARTRRGRRKWKLRAEQWRADQWHVRGWGPAGGWETHCHVSALTMPHYDWECRHRAGTMSLPGSAAHKHSHLWHSAKQFISQNFSESMQRADDCVLKAFVTVKRSPIAILHSLLQLRVTRNRRATVRIISHTIDTQCIKLPGFGFSSDSFCGGLSFYLDNNTLNSSKVHNGINTAHIEHRLHQISPVIKCMLTKKYSDCRMISWHWVRVSQGGCPGCPWSHNTGSCSGDSGETSWDRWAAGPGRTRRQSSVSPGAESRLEPGPETDTAALQHFNPFNYL